MLFILFVIIVIIIIILLRIKSLEHMETNIKITLVISRYNEDLEWLKEEPFNKYPVIIYNKGINNNYYIPPNAITYKLPNVGRCDHTYLYHIIKYYDLLEGNIIFLPGSNNIKYKMKKSLKLIKYIEMLNKTVFIGYYFDNVKKNLYNFKLSNYIATNSNNAKLNPEKKLTLSPIRPFGKWYDHHFGDMKINYVSYYGIIGINSEDILQHPKSYYENLIKDVSTSSNPEAGHYFERAWNAIFYSNDIKYYNDFDSPIINFFNSIGQKILYFFGVY